MMRMLIFMTLGVVFVLTVADPLKLSLPENYRSSDITGFDDEINEYNVIDGNPLSSIFNRLSAPSHVIETVTGALGESKTETSLVKLAKEWAMTHYPKVMIGAAIILGICKITDYCQISEDDPFPFRRIQNVLPEEYLDSAEKLLIDAIEKYTKNVRNMRKKANLSQRDEN